MGVVYVHLHKRSRSKAKKQPVFKPMSSQPPVARRVGADDYKKAPSKVDETHSS